MDPTNLETGNYQEADGAVLPWNVIAVDQLKDFIHSEVGEIDPSEQVSPSIERFIRPPKQAKTTKKTKGHFEQIVVQFHFYRLIAVRLENFYDTTNRLRKFLVLRFKLQSACHCFCSWSITFRNSMVQNCSPFWGYSDQTVYFYSELA